MDSNISQLNHQETSINSSTTEDMRNNLCEYTAAWESYQRELQINQNFSSESHPARTKSDSSNDESTDRKPIDSDLTESEDIVTICTFQSFVSKIKMKKHDLVRAKRCLYHHRNPAVIYFKTATEFCNVGRYADAIYPAQKAFDTAREAYPPSDTASISALKTYLDGLTLS